MRAGENINKFKDLVKDIQADEFVDQCPEVVDEDSQIH
jgi:hypothetical protein